MKSLKKVLSAVLVVAMLVCAMSLCVGAASTPAAQTIEALPGETVTIRLSEADCYGISGDIAYDNRALFSSLTPGTSPYGQIRENKFILSSADKIECEVILTAKVSDTAAVGSKCVVTFGEYIRVDSNVTYEGPEGLKKTVTVVVVEKPVVTTTTTKTETPAVTTTTQSNTPAGATTTVKGDKPAGATTTVKGDKPADVTTTTGEKGDVPAGVTTTTGEDGTTSTTKKPAGAVTPNEELQELINQAETLFENDEIAILWQNLMDAYENAKKALKSGNSVKIEEAIEALRTALEAYNAKLAELGKSEIVYVDKPVEVLPTEPFCNIWIHKLWPILLIVSFVLNLGFIGLIVYYFVRRKQNLVDDTPMVAYDIDDDAPTGGQE